MLTLRCSVKELSLAFELENQLGQSEKEHQCTGLHFVQAEEEAVPLLEYPILVYDSYQPQQAVYL